MRALRGEQNMQHDGFACFRVVERDHRATGIADESQLIVARGQLCSACLKGERNFCGVSGLGVCDGC